MTLNAFLNNLNNLLEANPSIGELSVCTAKDDEGNGFSFVNYEPSIGYMDDHNEFSPSEKEEGDYNPNLIINAVLLN